MTSAAPRGRRLPVFQALLPYQRAWFPRDLTAGLVLSALLVPQGMAYAELAGLPAVTGLYTSVLCLIGYAVFGASRILVLGPDSSLGPMIAATILPLAMANGDPAQAVALASMLSLLTGAIMLAAGLWKAGFIAELLSRPTMLGYMNGLAVTIIVGQLDKMLGFSVESDNFVGDFAGFVSGVTSGEVVASAAALGFASLFIILALKRWLPRVPGVLVAVIFAIAVTAGLGLADEGVKVVGVLPQGFPSLTWPSVGPGDLLLLAAGALSISLVSLTDTISTASSFAARRGESVDGNKEMIGIGAANIAAGLFQGFPVSTSGSRTAVADQAGAKSQLTGLVGAAVITLMLIAVPGLMQDLPQPTLGAVVVAAALSLADIPATRRLWHQRRTDFLVMMTAFLGVMLLGVLPGIAIAVAMSIMNVFRRLWWPYHAVLGRLDDTPGYHDLERYDEEALNRLPGCIIVRFDAPLIFANANTFSRFVLEQSAAMAAVRPAWIVVAAESISDADTTACDMLQDLDATLEARGHRLIIAEMKGRVREKLGQFGLFEHLTDDQFYPTVTSATKAYRRLTGA
ncbi:MAG TPA: SulP family inorganic anion transporter, partial [Actinomycetota bacterium]|nr:SulP family inorganic anion transporter [Actinomycetota bacterium]